MVRASFAAEQTRCCREDKVSTVSLCFALDPLRQPQTRILGSIMNKDQVRGTVKEATGKVQEVTGKVTGSAEQQVKGLTKQAEGKAQKNIGDVKEAVKDSGHR